MRESRYESEFQKELIDKLQRDFAVVLKLDPGTGTIPKGWPDLEIIWGNGKTMRCEVKATGGTVSPQQLRHMRLLAMAGHDVCFCDERPERCWPVPMTVEEIEAYEPPKR